MGAIDMYLFQVVLNSPAQNMYTVYMTDNLAISMQLTNMRGHVPRIRILVDKKGQEVNTDLAHKPKSGTEIGR